MQTQYEVKFLQSVFALKVELLNPSRLGYGSIYSLQMELKGRVQSVSSIWKVKDHGSRDMAWKPDIIFNFEHQTQCTRDVVEQPTYTLVV
jgi:hypothetical protein